jgi:putative ABC transport system substrate-binding protein
MSLMQSDSGRLPMRAIMVRQSILVISIALIVNVLFTLNLYAQISDVRDHTEQFKIFMVLWRGITEAEKGFMDYLSQRGINASFIIRDCEKDKSRLPEIMKEIKDIKPDLIYSFGTTVTTYIAGTTLDTDRNQFITDIPVVFNIVSDPIGAYLVPNLGTSGRNLTGASHMVPIPAQVKAMKSIMELHRLGVIYNPQERNSVLSVEAMERIAGSDGFVLIKVPIPLDENQKPVEDISPDIIESFADEKPDLVYLPSDSFVISRSKSLVNLITETGIPTFSATEDPIYTAGALMGLVSRYYNVGQFAGYKAEQILVHKKRPEDIPIETLKRFSFIINMKTAKKLEFYPPIMALKFAEVITE